MTEHWFNGPVDRSVRCRVSRRRCRTVLVAVSSTAADTTLMDALSLLEADHRITTIFTVVPGPDGTRYDGVAESLRARGCVVVPWRQAGRSDCDLMLSASADGLVELLLPQGTDATRAWPATGRRVLALAYNSASDAQVASGTETAVVGDICYDRLLASVPFRARYRYALGVSREQKLVVVTSTWHPESTLASRLELVARLVGELPARRFRVAVTVDPSVWNARGEWQFRTWLADCVDAGALLVRPDDGWRGALIAANLVIGDHGPATRYGAAVGLPTLVAAPAVLGLGSDSATEHFRRHAPVLRTDRPFVGQVRAALAEDRSWQDGLAARITARPGMAGECLRRLMYRELGLREPARAVPCPPVPLPSPVVGAGAWWKDASPV